MLRWETILKPFKIKGWTATMPHHHPSTKCIPIKFEPVRFLDLMIIRLEVNVNKKQTENKTKTGSLFILSSTKAEYYWMPLKKSRLLRKRKKNLFFNSTLSTFNIIVGHDLGFRFLCVFPFSFLHFAISRFNSL